MYSMRLCECFSITDSIQIKGFTCRDSGDKGSSPCPCSIALTPRCETETPGRTQLAPGWPSRKLRALHPSVLGPPVGVRTHVGVEPVGHELELAIRRDEGDGAVILEA